jgi:hypothetical protein
MSGREIFARGLYVSGLCRETFSETPHTIISSNNFFFERNQQNSWQAKRASSSEQKFISTMRNNIF